MCLEWNDGMRVLGIDPGYAIVGFGVLDYDGHRFSPVEYGAILTESDTAFQLRLKAIADDMRFIFEKFSPEALAIEKLYFGANHKTGIDVAQARGVILLTAAEVSVPIFEYTPLQVKQGIAGYGKADKRQVMEMTKTILKLTEIPKPDDAADALAIAICHCHNSISKLRKIN